MNHADVVEVLDVRVGDELRYKCSRHGEGFSIRVDGVTESPSGLVYVTGRRQFAPRWRVVIELRHGVFSWRARRGSC